MARNLKKETQQTMENETSNHQKKELISSFINIAVDKTKATAVHYLNKTNWNLEDAINLFLTFGHQTPECQKRQLISSFINITADQREETAVQFLDATRWNLDDAVNLFFIARKSSPHHQDAWDSLYRPPLDLLFNGSFEDAKETSFKRDRWLLVNLQSATEFASHALNRDVWSNDVVSQVIRSYFVLWQVYDDTDEGHKISTFYKIDSVPPVILLIDPITDKKMHTWSGMIEAHGFLEDLMPYRDVGPREHDNQDMSTFCDDESALTQEHVASLTSNKRIKTEKVCFPSTQADDNQDMSTLWDDDRALTQERVSSLTSNKRIKTEKVCFPSSEADDYIDMFSFSDDDRALTPS